MYILHLTDLHYRSGNAFQKDLTSALITDLKAAVLEGRRPDVVVFSGDLVDDPDQERPTTPFYTIF